MNVRLAAATLSKSVADCIDLLHKDMKNSRALTKQVNTFATSNFKPKMLSSENNFKRPLNESTATEFFGYFRSIEIDVVNKKTVKGKATERIVSLRLRLRLLFPLCVSIDSRRRIDDSA